jgi:spermidine synthase
MTRAITVSASPRIRQNKALRRRNIRTVRSQKPSSPKSSDKLNTSAFAALLFCSGVAALVYQVLWIKQLSLVVGVEIYSISIAVSAFFAGLALGGFVIGRWADRLTNPLFTYALLEAGIAFLGIAATSLLGHTAQLFATMEAHVGLLAWGLPFLIVGLPAFLMGGTLPIALCSQPMSNDPAARTGGGIYAMNTFGGIVGILACSFIFLPQFGVMGTGFAAASFNLIAVVIAFVISRTPRTTTTIPPPIQQSDLPRQAILAIVLYSLAGGIALGYEVVWSQAIVQFITTRSFAFSIVLATYLSGLALGSWLYARYVDKVTNPWGTFGFLIAAAGMVALLEIACLGIWQLRIQATAGELAFVIFGNQFARMCSRFIIAAVGIVFLPTLFLGAAFPAALHLILGKHRVGRGIGTVIALNTAGGIAGTLLTGFLLVPKFGLVRTLGVLAIVASAVGVIAVVRSPRDDKRMRWFVITISIAALVIVFVTPADRLARLLTTTRGGGKLISYEESKAGTVAVVQQSTGTNSFNRLYVHGISNSGDAMPSLRYMRLQALLPLILHNGIPHSALVVGFGTGITAGALLEYPQLNRRVCAELLPAVVSAGKFFHGNFGASHNPELQIRIRDGRRELMRSTERYDLITLEPPPPSASGVVNLYSRDFYELAAKRLEQNGIFAQWLPIATQNDEDTRSLVRSFLDVFPTATLWTTELHEMLLIGSLAPMELNVDNISQRFEQPTVNAAFKEVGISSPAALLATWVTGREGLEQYADGAPSVTDNHPRIEYSSWVRPDEITRVLPELLALKTEPPLIGSNFVLSSALFIERENLMMFYSAGLDAYRGERQAWAHDIGDVLKKDPTNPYYRWSVGGK